MTLSYNKGLIQIIKNLLTNKFFVCINSTYICISIMGIKTHTKESWDTDIATVDASNYQLIVWNDEVNTFEWVIETLITICNHTEEQAEQCAMLIHFKGKYAVKEGDYEMLKPMCDAITERGIGATVEEIVG